MTEFRQLYMELLSDMIGTCGPPYLSLNPDEDLSSA